MHRVSTLIAAFALLASPQAMAQESSVTGTFDCSFEMVVDNCEGSGMKMAKGVIQISENGKRLNVKVRDLPTLAGRSGRRGKIRADGKGKPNATGMRTRFGLNGRVSGAKLGAVFVAEYFSGDKPQCTQSWSVAGKRAQR